MPETPKPVQGKRAPLRLRARSRLAREWPWRNRVAASRCCMLEEILAGISFSGG